MEILSPDSSDLLLKLHKKNRKFWQKFKFHEKPVDFKGRIGYADFRIKQKKEAIYHEKKLVERKRGISDLSEKF